jgi:hypothetical protein
MLNQSIGTASESLQTANPWIVTPVKYCQAVVIPNIEQREGEIIHDTQAHLRTVERTLKPAQGRIFSEFDSERIHKNLRELVG